MTTLVVPSPDSLPPPRRGLGVVTAVVVCFSLGPVSPVHATATPTVEAEPVTAAAPDEQAGPVAAPPPIDKASDVVLQVTSSGHLLRLFEGMDYSYRTVRDDNAPVPRIFLEQFPPDIHRIGTYEDRVSVFFNALLPIVLRVNEDIARDRGRLIALRDRIAAGETAGADDEAWLSQLAHEYDVADRNLDELLVRVDIVPPSMALAQSAVESGWGTSPLARQGNVLFGLVAGPGAMAQRGHPFATYDQIIDSVTAYVHNLNTNPAYRTFRVLRAAERQAGRAPDGYQLMAGLMHYSELGARYIAYIRQVMRENELAAIDGAHLVSPADELALPTAAGATVAGPL